MEGHGTDINRRLGRGKPKAADGSCKSAWLSFLGPESDLILWRGWFSPGGLSHSTGFGLWETLVYVSCC